MNKISRRVILGGLGSAIVSPSVMGGESLDVGRFFAWTSTQVVPRCTPETCYSVVEPPGYDVPGMTRQYVLGSLKTDTPVQRVRFMTNAIGQEFGNLAGLINDEFINIAIKARMGELIPIIGESIEPKKTGYLLRINLAQDPNTGRTLASPNLVEAVGVGREPLDALAESYRVDTLRGPRPSIKSIRRYFWCIRQDDELKVDCANEVLSEELERQAREEAERRRVLGLSGVTDANQALERVTQAEDWQEVSAQYLRQIDDQAKRALIENLNLKFEASQQRFNESYAQYQLAQRKLAENAREMAVLSRISAVMSALSTGLAASNQLGPGESSEAALRWREHQSAVLNAASQKAVTEFNLNSTFLREAHTSMRNELTRMGIQHGRGELVLPVIRHY
jgi:hypothetical protein